MVVFESMLLYKYERHLLLKRLALSQFLKRESRMHEIALELQLHFEYPNISSRMETDNCLKFTIHLRNFHPIRHYLKYNVSK